MGVILTETAVKDLKTGDMIVSQAFDGTFMVSNVVEIREDEVLLSSPINKGTPSEDDTATIPMEEFDNSLITHYRIGHSLEEPTVIN